MGLFDKVKSMKDAVTGGAAKVYAEAEASSFSEPFTVTIRASSTGGEVKYNRVYLKVEGIERIELDDTVRFQDDGESHSKRVRIDKRDSTLSMELNVAPGGVIPAGETEGWTIDVKLPDHAQPTFRGRYSRHYYAIWAGLDCFGNDPDSGWVELHIK